MKTRIIHTKFWNDNYVKNLDTKTKLFYLYLLTNEFVNILSLYELPRDICSLQTSLSEEEIEIILKKLKTDNKIDYYRDYIYLENSEKYQYYKGIKNIYSKMRLIFEMGSDVTQYFAPQIALILSSILEEIVDNHIKDLQILNLMKRLGERWGIDIPLSIYPYTDTTNKPEIINQKPEIVKRVEYIKNEYGQTVAKIN